MAKVHIGGAGGAPSNNVIRSLRESHRHDHLIGASCLAADLFLADTDERVLLPRADAPDYDNAMLRHLERRRPDLVHVQNDLEVRAVSRLRERIEALGVRLFLPAATTIERCVDKWATYEALAAAGVPAPRTVLVGGPADLEAAFHRFGGSLWLRAAVGGGGSGALPTNDPAFARGWLERFGGWGRFTAAERLTPDSVTWLSLWHDGELVVAQGRRRMGWKFGNRALSGVTGITAVARTVADEVVDRIAEAAVHAVDPRPHGLFGVDLTYDRDGLPRVTEINIGRFFTTIYFFTRAGLNLPEIYCDIALDGRFPDLATRRNPLPEGLVWIRGMDQPPVLTDAASLAAVEREGGLTP
jgi:hypothetical protein